MLKRIKWWEQYTAINDGVMNNNPSPGNKAGGLSTILEKSLGAVAKGGTTVMSEVYEYSELVRAKGREIFETILRIASGERSKSERLGYGDSEFVPWQVGAVM
ncbi:MAG: hypothetical protein WEB85_01000 [Dongiaceae bacterium]